MGHPRLIWFLEILTVVCSCVIIGGCILYANTRYSYTEERAMIDNQHARDFSAYNNLTPATWTSFQSNGQYISSPIIYDNTIYIGSLKERALVAIDAQSGSLLWSFKAEDDIPFSPAITRDSIFITTSDGRLYALNRKTGAKRWEHRLENFYSIATTPLYSESVIYFGGRDKKLHAINANTGNEIWKFETNDYIDSSPVMANETVYFGGFDGYMHAINVATRKEVWKYNSLGSIIASPTINGDTIYFGNTAGKIFALNIQSGKKNWDIQVNEPIETSMSISGDVLICTTKKNTVYGISLQDGVVLWQKHIDTGPYTSTSVDQDFLYIGSSDGLYAINIQTGMDAWNYKTTSMIENAPSISQASIVAATRNGEVFLLNKKTGKSFINPEIHAQFPKLESTTKKSIFPIFTTVTQNSKHINQYDMYELMINHNESFSTTPWKDATISAIFTSKSSNNSHKVSGFYYDTNMWKIRFAPQEAGEWNWQMEMIINGRKAVKKSGFFISKAVKDMSKGFLRINLNNSNLLTSADKSFYYPLGIQTCLYDRNDNGYPLDSAVVDGKEVDIDTYLRTHGKNGSKFNLFRFGSTNCSFAVWSFDNENSQSIFLRKEGIWLDSLYSKLQKNGFHIWMSLLNNNSTTKTAYQLSSFAVFQDYIRYVIARYGVYVDVWELTNEDDLPEEWITYASKYIRTIDPYKHLVTTSWERPELDSIQINAPHRYNTSALSEADLNLSEYIRIKDYGKPMVFGEFGNSGSNWDPESAKRMRIQIWTSFFSQAGIIFWDSSFSKKSTNSDNANIYLGPEERSFVAVLQTITSTLDPNIKPIQIVASNPSVRSYAMQTPLQYIGYLYHFTDQNSNVTTEINVPIDISSFAIISWISPSTGEIIRKETTKTGSTIISPPFSTDVIYITRTYLPTDSS